jgi:WD40 repeat protein
MNNQVYQVSFNVQGTHLITGGTNGYLKSWDPVTGQLLQSLNGHRGNIMSLAYSDNDLYLVSGDNLGKAIIWDTQDYSIAHSIEFSSGYVSSAHFSSNGKYLALCAANEVVVLETNNWRKKNVFSDYPERMAVAFTPTNDMLLIGDGYGELSLVELASGKVRSKLASPHSEIILRIIMSSSKQICYVWDTYGILELNLSEFKYKYIITSQKERIEILPGDVSEDRMIVASSFDGEAYIFDKLIGKRVQDFVGHTNVVYNIVFSPDANYVLTGSGDGTARLWVTSSGKEIHRFEVFAD